jgi:hypothetical protein
VTEGHTNELAPGAGLSRDLAVRCPTDGRAPLGATRSRHGVRQVGRWIFSAAGGDGAIARIDMCQVSPHDRARSAALGVLPPWRMAKEEQR